MLVVLLLFLGGWKILFFSHLRVSGVEKKVKDYGVTSCVARNVNKVKGMKGIEYFLTFIAVIYGFSIKRFSSSLFLLLFRSSSF